MKKLSIYLDTSIINFLFADDAPELKEITTIFFENYIKTGVYDVYISPVVIDEIQKTKDNSHKTRLLNVISEYQLQILNIEFLLEEIQHLSLAYIKQKIIPKKKLEDALHIAISTIFEMDVLLSWNYGHLANVNKERKVSGINIQEGYSKPLRIVTPLEVLYYEEG